MIQFRKIYLFKGENNMLEKLKSLTPLLHKIFWIDKFEGKDKLLFTVAKFFMYFYIIAIILSFLAAAINLSFEGIIATVVGVIIIPIVYRIVMWMHKAMRGL
jgi:amino acid permease